MKKFLLFALLGGCAAGGTHLSASGLSPRPSLLGEPGEKPGHLYARILTRLCSGTEDDELVSQVAGELGACKGSRLDCEVAACESLREPRPACLDTVARR